MVVVALVFVGTGELAFVEPNDRAPGDVGASVVGGPLDVGVDKLVVTTCSSFDEGFDVVCWSGWMQ